MSETVTTPPAESRLRRSTRFTAAILIWTAISGALGGDTVAIFKSHETHAAEGLVRCVGKNTMDVTGVWIDDGPDDSGWASWRAVAGPSVAQYDRDIHGRSYEVHVGCGGTVEDWLLRPNSMSPSPTDVQVGYDCGPESELLTPILRTPGQDAACVAVALVAQEA
jgi:hypothetical protein